LLGVVLSLCTLLPSILYPYLAEAWNKKGNYQTFFNMAVKYTLLIAVPSIVGFAVMREEIVTLVSGDAYVAATTVIPVLSFYPLAAAFNYLLGQLLLLRRQTVLFAGIYIAGGIANIALNVLLVPRLGILGAAWATLVSYVLVFLLLLWTLRATLSVSFAFVRFPRILGAALLMAAALFFVQPQVFWTKLLAILGGAALYGVLVLLFGVFDKKELAVAKKMLQLPAWLG
jgi:O-antigen/teichoic acid export membrane protein